MFVCKALNIKVECKRKTIKYFFLLNVKYNCKRIRQSNISFYRINYEGSSHSLPLVPPPPTQPQQLERLFAASCDTRSTTSLCCPLPLSGLRHKPSTDASRCLLRQKSDSGGRGSDLLRHTNSDIWTNEDDSSKCDFKLSIARQMTMPSTLFSDSCSSWTPLGNSNHKGVLRVCDTVFDCLLDY